MARELVAEPSLPQLRCSEATRANQLHWILRVSCAFCFIGHGAFGIVTKAGWIPFFGLVGIPEPAAYIMMPLVGMVDITLGALVLFRPRGVVLAWMLFWTLGTALLRPLSGMGWWEFFERGGNYGAPLAMLLLFPRPKGLRAWLAPLAAVRPDPEAIQRATGALRITVGALLAGHAGLALAGTPLLLDHMRFAASILPLGDPNMALSILGGSELVLAAVVLVAPAGRALLLTCLLVSAWKIGTELLFPLSGDYVFEFIERAGSYGTPLALAVLLTLRRDGRRSSVE